MLPKSGNGTAPLASSVPGSGWLRLRSTARLLRERADDVGRHDDVAGQLAFDAAAELLHHRPRRVLEGRRAQLQVADHQVRRIEKVRREAVLHQEHRRGGAGAELTWMLRSPGGLSAS